MATTKPDVNEIWASSGAIIDPGVPKTQLGWIAEVPTFQNFNWLLNRQDAFNAHINEQGIAVHDLDTPYPEFAWAKGSDGTVYVAKQANTGEDPVLDVAETFWEPVLKDLPKSIASSGFITLSGGLILQWGFVPAVQPTPIVFPVTFPTAVFAVMGAILNPGVPTASFSMSPSVLTTSGFTAIKAVSIGGAVGETGFYFAIGN